MKHLLLILTFTLTTYTLTAQTSKFRLNAGLSAATTTSQSFGEQTGIGAFVSADYFLCRHFSTFLSLGIDRFSNPLPHGDDHISNGKDHYSLIPVIAGVRYYPKSFLYGSLGAGMSFSGSAGVKSNAIIVPAAGINLPLGRNVLDIGLQYTLMPNNFGNSATTILQRGQYNYLSLKIAYGFNF